MQSLPHSDSFAVAVTVLVVLFVTVVIVAQVPPPICDARLIGTWQSDAERTIAELRVSRSISDEQHTKLQALFGKLRITYATDGRWKSDLEGHIDRGRYRIYRHAGTLLSLLAYHDHPTKLQQLGIEVEPTYYRIQFDGDDGYWLTHDNDGSREYFRRVR